MPDDARLQRRILLVEDEESLILTLQDRLESEGYAVMVARDGDTALEAGTRDAFDCIVLDVSLPRKNGFDVCRDLRTRGIQTPILMLTARGQLIDRVLGLKLGADDYLTKPFEMLELLARIEALLRRARTLSANSADAYSFGNVEVDFRRAEVRRDREPVEISALELKLLRYLIEHRGSVLSRDELLEKVWGYDAMPVTRTVDVHIASLRQKLGPEFILTIHGMGYKFVG
jgi:two-component system alkaline phosphatase synthesis response regulator PhoP